MTFNPRGPGSGSVYPVVRRLVLFFAYCLGAVLVAATPAHVLIRVPAGTPLPAELAPLLAKWRQTGQVANVLLLTQGKSEKPEHPAKFESFAVLEFSSEDACGAWQKEAAPLLPAGLIVRRADVLAQGGMAPNDSLHSCFIVNTYTPLVPSARFGEYVLGYVKPLYEGMLGTKHLLRYTAYLERGEPGKADALNVLEYRDKAAWTAMGKVKGLIREQVAAANPSYAKFDKIKDTLRVDGFGTCALYTPLK